MSLMWMFYFAGVVDNLTATAILLSGLVLTAYCAYILFGAMAAECSYREEEAFKRYRSNLVKLKRYPIVAVCLLAVISFIPDKQTIYTMAAAYGVQEAVANPDVQRVAGKSLAVIEKTLDAYLKEDKSNGNSSE